MTKRENSPISRSQMTSVISSDSKERKWFFIDLSGKILGRIASEVALKLRGKQYASFSRNIDGGDFVVLLNSDKIFLTGRKMKLKKYYSHSGYPGGLTERKAEWFFSNNMSEKVIWSAIRGQMPSNKLRDKQLSRLHIFRDSNHNHIAQFKSPYAVKEII